MTAVTAAHTVNFTLNGQVWVCARYCRWYRRDPAALDAFLRRAANGMRALPWLREAVCIGSLGRTGTVRGDRADLDLRLVFPLATPPGSRSTCCCCGCEPGLSSPGSRSTSMPTTDPSGCAGSTSGSLLLVLLDRDGRLAQLYPAASHPGHEASARLDRDSPDLLGLFPRRPSGRTGACHRGHPLHRPLRRHLRGRPAATRAARAHLPGLPSAPVAMAHIGKSRPVHGHRAARAAAAGAVDRGRRGGAGLPAGPPFGCPPGVHRDRRRAGADADGAADLPVRPPVHLQWPEKLAAFPRAVLARGPLL